MSSDYTESKTTLGLIAPENQIDGAYDNLEPVLTPQALRLRHLFGIPLVSKMRDPITGEVQVITDEMLVDFIARAVTTAETLGHFDIFPKKRREKLPFDKNAFDSLGYFQVKYRPVWTVDRVSVTPANGIELYVLPKDWIEAANFQRGQINIIPVNIALTGGGFIPAMNAGGSLYFSILNMRGWVPAYWQIDYTSGFPDAVIPREVNELIGVCAAIDILSMLATTDADVTSRSLGIDGMSQSVGGPGADKFKPRIEQLMVTQKSLIGKLRGKFGTKIFSSHL